MTYSLNNKGQRIWGVCSDGHLFFFFPFPSQPWLLFQKIMQLGIKIFFFHKGHHLFYPLRMSHPQAIPTWTCVEIEAMSLPPRRNVHFSHSSKSSLLIWENMKESLELEREQTGSVFFLTWYYYKSGKFLPS